jgi:hypothetical protein
MPVQNSPRAQDTPRPKETAAPVETLRGGLCLGFLLLCDAHGLDAFRLCLLGKVESYTSRAKDCDPA